MKFTVSKEAFRNDTDTPHIWEYNGILSETGRNEAESLLRNCRVQSVFYVVLSRIWLLHVCSFVRNSVYGSRKVNAGKIFATEISSANFHVDPIQFRTELCLMLWYFVPQIAEPFPIWKAQNFIPLKNIRTLFGSNFVCPRSVEWNIREWKRDITS